MENKQLQDRCIICFAGEDWWFHNPHSNLHLMKAFAAKNRVLFVNSTGIKMPDYKTGGFFWKRVGNKLKSLWRYFKQAEPNLYVLTPFALPLIKGRENFVSAVNRVLMIIQLRLIIFLLGFHKPVIWVTSPVARDIALHLKNVPGSGLVYYCCDNLSRFPGVNESYILRLERDIQKAADVSFYVNRQLARERETFGQNIHVISHGVDYDHFASVMSKKWPVPADLTALNRPVAGYIGEIKPLDFDLVRFLALAHPQMSFVFLGDIYAELELLGLPANVVFLGKKPYEQLPAYMQNFDVCCLYYNTRDDFNVYRNPKKLMEYLATGKPIVSVDIPQVREFEGPVAIARDPKDFSILLEKAIKNDTPLAREQRSKIAREHTWEEIAKKAGETIVEAMHG